MKSARKLCRRRRAGELEVWPAWSGRKAANARVVVAPARMTSIERLQIQGIRSYSPFEPQTVEFYKPLTVIVGQNGCGKTTIIECLKQATTGDLPPNCKNGQNFVHDPNLASTTEVKGQIKLRFRSADGKPVVCSRSFNLTQRQKKKEYKALESVLTTLDSTGAKVTLSTKCADLNKQVPQLMGVSHAILDNVIFCHQEEANWCLGDDATLKKRFDEIFASARYTKAMDEIRRHKNELHAHVKVLRAEADGAEARLQAARRLSASAEADRAELDKLQRRIAEHDEAAATLGAQLDGLRERAARAASLERDAAALRVAAREKRAQAEEVCSNLGAQFGRELQRERADDELQRALDEHTATQARRRRDEAAARRDAAELASRRAALDAAQAAARDRAAQLRAEANSARLREADRDAALGELAPEIAPAAAARARAPYTPAAVAEFERALAAELHAREALAADARDAERNGVAALTADVERASLELRSTRAELARAERELRDARAELSAAEARAESSCGGGGGGAELTQTSAGASRGASSSAAAAAAAAVGTLRARLDAEEAALDELRDARAADNLRGKLTASARELACAKLAQKALLAEIDGANERTAAAQRYDDRLAARNRRDDEIGRALDALREDLAVLLDGARDARRTLVDGSLGRAARAARDVRAAELGRATERAADARRALAELGGSAKAREAMVRAKQRELRVAEEAVRARGEVALLEPAADVDALIRSAQDELVAASNDLALVRFVPGFVTAARRQLDDAHACKLCARGVRPDERAAVEASFKALVARSATGEADVQAELSRAERRLVELNDLAPAARKLNACRAELAALDAQRARALDELRDATAAAEAADAADAAARAAHDAAARAVAGVERLAPAVDEFLAAKRDVDLCNDATDTTGARSADEVVADVRAAAARVDALEAEHARLLERADKSDATQRAADTRARDLRDELQAAERALDKAQADEKAVRRARERVAPLEAAVTQLGASAQPLQAALNAAEAARAAGKARLEADERAASAAARELAGRAARFRSLQGQVVQHGGAEAQRELDEAIAAEAECTAKLGACAHDADALAARAVDASRSLTRAEAEVAELRENLRVRRIRAELREVERELEAATAALDAERAADGTSPRELLALAEARLHEMGARRAEAVGKRKATEAQRNRTEGELKSGEYKGVDAAHRAKSIELATHTTVVRDLDTYYKALDRSLMRFHSKKMADINGTIRELWQRTYQGHDIDSIEIQSEHEGETASGKRIHRYRVVMRRGDARLDMRGRCSAGQKVLASLIIRLALAETFCLNCGILALDEPTTNLDHANVESFARALNEIITQRRSQANFQLIVITHDEPFVQLIGRAENADYFYRVFKNEQQYSVVQRQAIADF
ncbi:hypothetical protein KFE25_001378 [Diacronema lutheri]|uniref:DNA repair protein RAD50 n=1 Tax=Diacronema lutheri TaxID=2081491 RepID=A0A8J5XF55_DIALT|nr:hypothetical protein KFE25_001378 [Diacronema lutheri]